MLGGHENHLCPEVKAWGSLHGRSTLSPNCSYFYCLFLGKLSQVQEKAAKILGVASSHVLAERELSGSSTPGS